MPPSDFSAVATILSTGHAYFGGPEGLANSIFTVAKDSRMTSKSRSGNTFADDDDAEILDYYK